MNPTGSQQRDNQPTSGTSHPGYWKIQNGEWGTRTSTEKNIGGSSNTALAKASGSTTRQKITGSGPVTHQEVKESPRHQEKETETRRLTSLRTSRQDFWPSRTKLMYKNSFTSST